MKCIKNNLFYFTYILIFCMCELVLSILVHTSSSSLDYIYCYICVLLAFFGVFAFFKLNKRFLFTALALFFTAIADIYLVVLDKYYLIGVLVFLVAQVCYALRIFVDTKSKTINIIHLIVRLSVSILGVFIVYIVLLEDTDILSVVSVIYYLNLILNCVFSFILVKDSRFNLILAIGFLMFAFCDIFVGIGNFESYFNIPYGSILYKIIHHKINFSWVFYIPSQTLLSLSLFNKTYLK